jgi:hypothetical protein
MNWRKAFLKPSQQWMPKYYVMIEEGMNFNRGCIFVLLQRVHKRKPCGL